MEGSRTKSSRALSLSLSPLPLPSLLLSQSCDAEAEIHHKALQGGKGAGELAAQHNLGFFLRMSKPFSSIGAQTLHESQPVCKPSHLPCPSDSPHRAL
jgi:hypothetical protein